jgi:GH43 family beta-xylosidase
MSVRNPLLPVGADPWMVRHGDRFHLFESDNERHGVTVRSAAELSGLAGAEPLLVWRAGSGRRVREIWAPEGHFLDGRWYCYVAADDGDNANHRMLVLGGGEDPRQPYQLMGTIGTPGDRWAIDGTVLDHVSGGRYFVWSGWEGSANIRQNLYIAAMVDPGTLAGERQLLSVPDLPWERSGGPPFVNEGPAALIRNGYVFVVYSAGGSWSDHYCLGLLSIPVEADPLEPAGWTKSPQPVFVSRPGAYGPGHCSFCAVGQEDWIFYHANAVAGSGWAGRSVRGQRFGWGPDGFPDFGVPLVSGAPAWGAPRLPGDSSAPPDQNR